MELRGQVQNYEWGKLGKDSMVANLLASGDGSAVIDEEKPYAELWVGTHPNGPALIIERDVLLSEYLKSNADAVGPDVKKRFGITIPFLLKVLSIRKALSIQAHPDKAHAEILHRDAPHLYKDPNHKPELAIALTPFEALCGFRPTSQINNFISSIPELRAVLSPAAVERALAGDTDSVKMLFASLMKADKDVVAKNLDALLSRLHSEPEEVQSSQLYGLVGRLAADFPGDVGCWSVYLLNYLTLRPGQAIFLAPNLPHAYLSGDCVECMACSDNVVRAGLTPKHLDVETLLAMLDYGGRAPEELLFQPQLEDEFSCIWRPPIPVFVLTDCVECMACSDNVVRAGLTPKHLDVETLFAMLDYGGRAPEELLFQPQLEDEFSCIWRPPIPDFVLTDCVECMACSDNVVRAGLTPKHLDVETLLAMLDYGGRAPEELLFQPQLEDEFSCIWRPPIPDFVLTDCVECMACSDNVVRAGLTPKHLDVETLLAMLDYGGRAPEELLFQPQLEDEFSCIWRPLIPDFVLTDCVECMACSDNVVRAGLTPKHLDVETLLAMLDYGGRAPEELLFQPQLEDEFSCIWRPLIPDFVLTDCVECMACSDNVVRAGLTPKHLDVETLLAMLDYGGRAPEELLFQPQLEDEFSCIWRPLIPDFVLTDCVECMACSDNVVRAGLTPKHLDVETLLAMLDYGGRAPEELLFQPQLEDEFSCIWRPPIPDFAVVKITIPSGAERYNTRMRAGPSVFLVVSGRGSAQDTEPVPLAPGTILFLKASRQLTLTATEDLVVYQALCNVT